MTLSLFATARKEAVAKVGVGVFSQITCDRKRENVLKLSNVKFKLDIRKKNSSVKGLSSIGTG